MQKLASFPGLWEGGGKAWYALFAHVHNYCKTYVIEQWACTQNVIINCTRVFEIQKEVRCSTAVERRKERRAALSRVDGPCANQALLLTELSSCLVAVESSKILS